MSKASPENSSAPPPARAPGTSLLKRVRRLPPVEWLVSYLFGDDVFISYSRRDGIEYGVELSHRLSDAGYSVRMDVWETEPGKQTPEKVMRALRRSRNLVVVGTPGALHSPHVAQELAFYKKTHPDRTNIIPVHFGDAVPVALWLEQVEGLPWLTETAAAYKAADPSAPVVKRIRAGLRFTRRNRRLFKASVASLGLLLLLLTLVGAATVYALAALADAAEAQMEAASATQEALIQQEAARRSAEEAEAKAADAREAARIADDQRLIAEHQGREAARQSKLAASADRQRQAAERATEAARRQEAEARRNARQQQAIAQSRRLAGEADRLKQSALDLSLLLSEAAFDTYPTFEARRSLLTTLGENRNLAFILHLPGGYARQVVAAPDGETIITGGTGGEIIVWDVKSLKPRVSERVAYESPIALTPDGKILAASDEDGLVLWDVRSGARLSPGGGGAAGKADGESPGHPKYTRVSALADNKTLVTLDRADTVAFWEMGGAGAPKSVKSFEAERFYPDGRLRLMAVSPGGDKLLTTSYVGEFHLWEVKGDGLQSPRRLEGHTAHVENISFSADGRWFVSGNANEVIVWNADTLDHTPPRKMGPAAPALSADGEWLLTGDGGRVRAHSVEEFWDPTYHDERADTLVGDYGRVMSLAFGGGSRYAISGEQRGAVLVWNFGGPRQLERKFKVNESVASTAFSPGGRMLAFGDDAGAVAVKEVGAAGAPTPLRSPHEGAVKALAFHPTREMFASAGEDGRVVLWTYAEGEGWRPEELPVADIPAVVAEEEIWRSPYATSFVAFADGGETLVSVGKRTGIVFWDIERRLRRHTVALPEPEQRRDSNTTFALTGVAATRDGRTLAAGFNDGTVRLLDTKDGRWSWRRAGDHKGEGAVHLLAFSPDGRWLASMDKHHSGVLWRVADRPEKCATFSYSPKDLGRPDLVNSIAFGRNAERNELTVAMATRDRVVLWDAVSHDTVGSLGADWHTALAFSPDGGSVAAGVGLRGVKSVAVYDLNPESWAEGARRAAARALTGEEKLSFGGGAGGASCAAAVQDSPARPKPPADTPERAGRRRTSAAPR